MSSNTGNRAARRLRYLAFAVASASIATLTACGAGPNADAGGTGAQPYRILYIGGISGASATAIKNSVKGMQASVDAVNDAGGIAGRPVVIEFKDSAGDPTKAVSLLQESLSSGEVPDAMIPSGSSAEALAMLPLLTRNKIVSVSYGASPLLNDPGEYPYHFQTASDTYSQLVGLEDKLVELDCESVGVLVSDDEYGNAVKAGIEERLANTAITVKSSSFPPADLDLTVPYQRMLSSDPDCAYLDAIGDPSVRLLEARVSAGGVSIATIAGAGMTLAAGGPYNYGSREANEELYILTARIENAVPAEEQTEAFEDFFARYSGGDPVEGTLVPPGLGWDQIRLLAVAANSSGALSDLPNSLVDAFYRIDAPEGSWLTQAAFTYTPDRHTPIPEPSDFPIIPSAPLVNGQYEQQK